jgi:hypothetical protein
MFTFLSFHLSKAYEKFIYTSMLFKTATKRRVERGAKFAPALTLKLDGNFQSRNENTT